MSLPETESLLNFEDARRLLSEAVHPLPSADYDVQQAGDQFLSQDIVARDPHPRQDVSAMDGYAVRNADLALHSLPVTAEAPAGKAAQPLLPGSSARIFTGAPLPPGADTVIPQELALIRDDGSVQLGSLPVGSHVRRHGEVYQAGDTLASAGDQLTPLRLALLASAGIFPATVHRQVRIAILVTGSELVHIDQEPREGQIRDCNGHMLLALSAQAGIRNPTLRIVPDSSTEIRAAIVEALDQADLILTSGGVSVGDYDFIPSVVDDLGASILFHRIRIKPGKPILAASFGEKWLLGLPGNPLSVLAGWRFFALPLIQQLRGSQTAFEESPPSGILTKPVANPGDRLHFLPCIRVTTSDRVEITPLLWKGSHDLFSAAHAQAFLRLDPRVNLDGGDSVNYYEFDRLHT